MQTEQGDETKKMRQTCNSDGGVGSTENVQARGITLLSIFVDTPTAEPNPETKLLADFKTDTHLRKVYLAGRGELAHKFSWLTSMHLISVCCH